MNFEEEMSIKRHNVIERIGEKNTDLLDKVMIKESIFLNSLIKLLKGLKEKEGDEIITTILATIFYTIANTLTNDGKESEFLTTIAEIIDEIKDHGGYEI